MALPGRAKQPEINQKAGNKASGDAKGGEEKLEELSFEQIQKMNEDLKKLQAGATQEELEKIRQAKEAGEPVTKGKKKKKKKDDRVDLKDITTELEERKGGLPEHIAKLPKNHPIRMRWEKGFRQREDGTWFKPKPKKGFQDNINLSPDQERAFYILPLILIGVLLVVGGSWYINKLSDTRKEIIDTIRRKGLSQDNPDTKEKLKLAYESHWLPELTSLLKEFKKVRRSFSKFGDNPEPGSYLDHIKRHGKEFDPQAAMQWRSRIIRKPHK